MISRCSWVWALFSISGSGNVWVVYAEIFSVDKFYNFMVDMDFSDVDVAFASQLVDIFAPASQSEDVASV